MDIAKNHDALTVEAKPHGDVLYAITSGVFTLADAQITFLQIIDAIRQYRSEKVLVDGRKVIGQPLTIERFFYGEFVAEESKRLERGSGTMFAYVLHEPVLDPLRLGETVALNRGMNIKVFDDYEMAATWLGVHLPDVE